MTWTVIDEDAGLWQAEKWVRKGWHLRCTAIALPLGGTLVTTPVKDLGDEAHAMLVQIGAPAYLLAANSYHHLALPEYTAAYPDAKVIASDIAAPRIAKKQPVEVSGLDSIKPSLPEYVELMVPAGLNIGGVWVRVETGQGIAWIVTDAFFNMKETPEGSIGLFCRLTGTTPGLRIGKTFTGLAVSNKREYREWLLDRIETDQPTILIPSHGEILAAKDLPGQLRDLTHQRLGR